jgi:predicted metal-binding membrane protein
MKFLAQAPNYLDLGNITGEGPLGTSVQNAPTTLNNVLSIVVGTLTIVAGVWFMFQIITGAITWIGAGGDKVAMENARKRIMNGFVGLVIVISAVFILDLVGTLLGLPFLANPGNFVNSVTP